MIIMCFLRPDPLLCVGRWKNCIFSGGGFGKDIVEGSESSFALTAEGLLLCFARRYLFPDAPGESSEKEEVWEVKLMVDVKVNAPSCFCHDSS